MKGAKMENIPEITTTIIALISAAMIIAKPMVSISNKTEVELILTPNQTRRWEHFLDHVLISLVLTMLIVLGTILCKLPLQSRLLNWISIAQIIITPGLIVIIGITKGVMKLIRIKPKQDGFLAKLIMSGYIFIFLFGFHLTLHNRSMLREKVIHFDYKFLAIVLFIIYFYSLIFSFLTLLIYRSFINPPPPKYKVIKFDALTIADELNKLYFIFALDQDTQVFSRFPTTRAEMKLPAYLFYPKECTLYCFQNEDLPSEDELITSPRSRRKLANKRY